MPNGYIQNPMKNHLGAKWFYIEPPEEPLSVKWFYIEPPEEPFDDT